MNILVIEDFRPMAKAIQEVLEQRGHQVTCVTGFNDVESLRAIALDGSETMVAAEEFELALVDGQLDGPFQGSAVVARLVRSGVKCFGISTENELNADMVTAGAAHAVNKAIAFVSFIGGLVTAEAVVSGDESVAQHLSECQANFRDEKYAEFRRLADEAIKRHLTA